MTEELITVISVNYNTSDFIAISLYGLSKLTKNKYKVIICDNGSRYLDKSKLKRIASKYSNVELVFRKQSAKGSMGHGEALNLLIEKIDAPYGVILDADAIFLKRGWDDILINQLDDKTKIIGCPPVKNPIKPSDFPLVYATPSVYATLFDTETFKSLHIDMRPKAIEKGQDTSWEMREKFLQQGYRCRVLEARNTREFKEGPFRDVLCAEYYLEGYNDIFACHFGRGATLDAAKYYKGNKLLKLLIIPAIKMKGYKEKRAWLDICKDIIESEERA
jgi:glycosyltransferase involved in cell wall biosynthesis